MTSRKEWIGKTLLITGGTGSFGNVVLQRFVNAGFSEIRIFSRDEKKQEDQRERFNSPSLKYYIGDVRDQRAVSRAMRNVNYVYHAAALKQVPSCEFHPTEAVMTNVMGTQNVIEAALQNGVERLICLSTDKAVYPVNAMGMSKALMEKVMVALSRGAPTSIRIVATRYGNVLASRGSVIPRFIQQIQLNTPITITDPQMTRFVMSLDEALDLVLHSFEHGENGDIFVQKAPATTIGTIAQAVKELMGVPGHPTNVIGTRHGEKRFETLLSREELERSTEMGQYFRVAPDNRTLNYSIYVDEGDPRITRQHDYSSDSVEQLDVPQLVAKLKTLPFMTRILAGQPLAQDD